jgi:hypothetical protein
MKKEQITQFLRFAAIAGNILFVLWVSFNAMDEGFSGTLVEKISGVSLICLLITNSILLLANRSSQVRPN